MRWLLLLLAASVAMPAAAGPLSIYGFNPRAVAMGGAQISEADDASAAFYNPALLTSRTRVTFGFGLQYVRPSLKVDELNYHFDDDEAPVFPQDFAQYTLGILFPLGGKVKNRISLGVALTLPHGYIVRIHTVDSPKPSFYLYQASAQKLVIIPAVAVRLGDFASVGVGLQVLARFGGDTTVAVDLFSRQVQQREMVISLRTTEALVAGITVGPFAGFTAGLVFRQEIGLEYEVPANIVMEDIGNLDLRLQGTALWSPHELGIGLSWEVPSTKTRISADLTYGVWQRAPSPEVTVVMDTGGPILDGLGLGSVLDLCSDRLLESTTGGATACVPISPGFVDNLTPRLGVEHPLSENLWLRGGYAYRPTPVPNQVHRTNYLDASTHVLSAGLGITFDDPLAVFQRPVTVDLAGQVMLLSTREVDKGSDGVIDYTFGGTLYQLGLAVRYEF
ncbi:MAG: outer membrane protein transport protein [Deltaproteobacteria bacterium]|nr:outer membrane protein transport protein [Deltaproteobacteria bacterium]